MGNLQKKNSRLGEEPPASASLLAGDMTATPDTASSARAKFDSPVTPPSTSLSRMFGATQNSSVTKAERIQLLRCLAHVDSTGRDLLIPITDVQMGYCREAVKQLTKKLNTTGGRRRTEKEFDSLLSDTAQTNSMLGRTTAARLDINQSKNRYMDVLPFDDTRVVLGANSQDVASSYINASYLTDLVHGNLPIFIATQGPLKGTVADFWEMVMQQQCPVIVMLTGLVDLHSKVAKCDSYFPERQETEVYGRRIKVTNTFLDICDGSIAVRLFEVDSVQSEDSRIPVLHLQYLDWPDHGVPTSSFSVREIFKKLYRIPPAFGPFVVHCSAGIGRTGAYCTIDHTLRRILLGDLTAVDIENTVRQFRNQRIGMVQTRDQYIFCYQTVIEGLQDIISKGGV